MITKKQEREKMKKVKDGLEEELLKIQNSLYHYAYILTSDRENAKDLLQDTMLKVLANRDKYISDTNFKGWVFTIMRNIFRNKRHKDCRINSLEDIYNEPYSLNIPYESGFVAEERDYTLKDIKLAIASFTEEYTIPFLMHHAGYKYEEIATYMHIPLGTVKSRIYYIRKKLQVLLKDYREDY